MAKRKINKTNQQGLKEKIGDFFESDSPGATATKFLLMAIAMGSIVFFGAAIPGIFKIIEALRESGEINTKQKYTKKQIDSALSNLKRGKFIKIVREKNRRVKVKLTNKGKKRIIELSLDKIAIKKPIRWDGKWRIVIFDIPVEYNAAREALRGKIKELGFRQLQKSVWIIPWECEDEILFISEAYGVEKYVEIITAGNLLHEKEIRKVFNI